MKKIALILGTLSILIFTSCSPVKRNDSSKNIEKSYSTEVSSDEWNEQLVNQKVFDPFGNVTINVKNGGKLIFGSDNPDLIIQISNGNIYIQSLSKYAYYVVPSNLYDASTGTYYVEQYSGYTDPETGEVVWSNEGSVEFDSLAFIAFYAAPAMRIQNLIYSDFTYNEENRQYELESLTTKGYGFPNDPDYLLKNINVSFKDGRLSCLNYFINQYYTEITSTFSDYGATEISSVESLMQ